MISYRYFTFIDFFPDISICLAYFLYKQKLDSKIALLYLFITDFIYSNFILLSPICFVLCRFTLKGLEQDKLEMSLKNFISSSINIFFFLLYKYLLLMLYNHYFYNFFNIIAQIIITIMIYPIIHYVLMISKPSNKNV